MIRRRSILLGVIWVIAPLATGVLQAQSVLTHHVPGAVRSRTLQPTGQLPANQILNLDLVLPLSNPAGLLSFLSDVYNPASPSYRQVLSVQQFTAMFGPSQQDYDAVVEFAQTHGFTVSGGSRDGMELQIQGPVSAVETAFHLTLRTYQHPTENRTFYAPDREPSHDLNFNLWHISGLDNYSIPVPLFVKRGDYAKAHGIPEDAVVSHATTGSGPSASFLGSDMRAAYYGGTALTGAGQNLGLWEYYGTDLADLTTYFTNTGQTNQVPVTLLSTDGTSTSCVSSSGCDDTEQTLDMTQAIGMAPGLASLVVYVGSSDTAIISAMTTHNPLPTTIGCSWGWTPVDPTTLDPYFEKMAAQGQTFFAASGDSSTWSSRNVAWPADDANVVSVGGTDLVTAKAAGAWQSETAWSDSGGGISPDKIAIPAWQQITGVINSSNKGSTTYRNGPDVSANANFTFYVCADQTSCTANEYGGTSFAAPMWAGYIALVNQQLASNSQTAIGFLNPTIYAQNVGSGYDADFHDITSGTSGSYSAVTGYDLVTGWGSPNSGLIGALTSTGPGFSLSASPAAVTVTQGTQGSTTITSTVVDGFNSPVTLSASGQPTGVTIGFNPTSITGSGSSTMTITASSSAATGPYSLTVTGTPASGSKETVPVSLTVSAAALATPTIAKAFNPTSISPGGTSAMTLTLSNSNASALTGGAFTDTLSGMSAAGGAVTGTCAGTSPSTLTAGQTALSFTGITIPASGSCTVILSLTSSTAGAHNNTTSGVKTTQTPTAGAASNTATLTVSSTLATPTIAKAFSPASISPGGTSAVTLTLSNSNASALTGGAFTDTLTNMSAAGGAVTGTCSGTSPSTLTAGQTALSFTGISIPASGSCTVIFSVTSNTAGGNNNTTSGVKTTQTPTAGAASNTATLTVSSALTAPTITNAFNPTSIFPGGTSAVTLTLSNKNPSPLTGAAFTDTLTNMTAVAGAVTGTCSGTSPTTLAGGQTVLSFTGILIPASSSCTVIFHVTSSTAGRQPNTTSGVTTTQTPTAGSPSNTAILTVF